jgi:hypothetical protein
MVKGRIVDFPFGREGKNRPGMKTFSVERV